MNAMSGEGYRRQGGVGADALDGIPDPFEDIAAPPLRVGPPPVRPTLVASTPMPRAADPADLVAADDDLHRPFELTDPADPAGAAFDAPPQPAMAAASRAHAAPAPVSGLRQLRAAAAFGLVLAAGIVALAVAFRPAPAPEGAGAVVAGAGETGAPTALGSGPVPAPAVGDAAATPAAAITVNLKVGTGAPEGRSQALEAAIVAAGYGGVSTQPVASDIERSRIEYFHAADRDAAEALARSLAPLTGQPLGVHDMTAVTIDAAPGRIDVLIAK